MSYVLRHDYSLRDYNRRC